MTELELGASNFSCVFAFRQKNSSVDCFAGGSREARHGTIDPRTYLISDGKRTLFYCLDTGLSDKRTYNYISEKNIKIDAVICDCAYDVLDITDDGYHMSLLDNAMHKRKLMEIGAIKEGVSFIVTHFSHNGLNKNGKAVPFKKLNKICKSNGFILSYDGFKIEI